MIGYYVHHQGRGHLHRAREIAAALGDRVVGLSSLERPDGWSGGWVVLPRDDDPAVEAAGPALPDADPTAGERLHWVPRGHPGLGRRMSALSAWFAESRPRCVVVDVSVEVALLARLHGIDVVTVAQPGVRADPAHQLGYAVSRAILAAWPPGVDLLRGVEDATARRVQAVGAISRFAVRTPRPAPVRSQPVATVLAGAGGDAFTAGWWDRVRRANPGWTWRMLGGAAAWEADPWGVLCDSDVVITHAGQNAVAEVAAARVPAVVLPQERPFDEQHVTAAVLAGGPWPALAAGEDDDLADLLPRARTLDGAGWAAWCDDGAAARAAAVIEDVAAECRWAS